MREGGHVVKLLLPGRIRGFVLTLIILILSYAFYAFALDAPHTNTPGYDTQCGSCHWTHSNSTAPWENTQVPEGPDNTINNRRCYTCHDGSKSLPVKTHSSTTTSSMYWTTLGGWKTECVTCHDPHQQRQTRAWGTLTYLVTGVPPVMIGSWVTDSNRTQITVAETLTDNYFGYYFMPDKNYPFYYKITTDTTNSSKFDVKGQLLTAYVKTGGYAIVYGKNVKEWINYANPGGTPVGGSVKLYRSSGANGPGDSGNATSSVCYVCHTRTSHWSSVSGDVSHKDGSICTECHEHSIGFKPSCKFCHGYPPTSDSAASPNGLVWVTGSTTGSNTAGAHNTHVNTKGIDCEACHYNSVGRNPSHEDHKITIGFNNLGGTTPGGAYDGQTSANYDVTVTTPATTVSNSGTKTCSNVYCHGNYSGSGKKASPVWDQPASGACGTCHGASNTEHPQSGSHQRHVGNTNYLDGIAGQQHTFNRGYVCSLCHKDIVAGSGPDNYTVTDQNAHVNAVTDWKFDTTDTRVSAAAAYSIATGTTAPSDGTSRAYGVCNNVYCHSNVQPDGGMGAPSQYTAPVWGAKLSCQGCHVPSNSSGMGHSATISTGSHTKHMSYAFNVTGQVRKCTLCHKWNAGAAFGYCDQCHTVGGSGEQLYHANGSVDVLFDSYYGNGAYNGTPQPGDGYGNCSNTYCHSNGTSVSTGAIQNNTSPTWGTGSLTCDACHSTPPDYANGSPKANSHQAHANAGITCDKCHNATTMDGSTITNTANHVNKAYDLQPGSGVSFTYTYNATGGSCASISCHGNTDATWGVSDCLGCHSASQGNRAVITPQFSANSHHIQGTVSNDKCYQCHWEANSDGSISKTYHGGSASPGSAVDLVIYGAGARPATYTAGTTAVQYTANGSRTEIQKINSHCLGCHSEQNNATQPFGDGKTPKQYSWDGYSVGAKYTSTATTTWGKYTTVANAAKKNLTKSYSAHGNAQNNFGGGWPDAPQSCFGPNVTQSTCPDLGGTWDSTIQQCNNISSSNCTQNFCTGGQLTATTCREVGGVWGPSSGICKNISESTCTTGDYCSWPTYQYAEYFACYNVGGQWLGWTGIDYVCLNMTQTACQTAGGSWTSLNGAWKTGGSYSEGVDFGLNPTRGGEGAASVSCFDCHNSHGSNVSGTTTSYSSATTSGGILKDTTAGKGGYSVTYQPQAGGSAGNKNAYNPGAGLCFDCHLTPSAGTKPWGYNSTYGASQPILGYFDTAYFGPGTFPSQQRYPYKGGQGNQGGHFGVSSGLTSPPDSSHRINGLCTPCHDPHGVSPALGLNSDYGVPLLKGTWMTSPFKEDVAPRSNNVATPVLEGIGYHIDQNTFASGNINESASQFAGLCLNCHTKGNLTDGVTHTWKNKNRIHESVKGWKTANGTIQHNYSCSKCHTPHNARLPRLMATNCLNKNHKGRVSSNASPVLSGGGSGGTTCESGNPYNCWAGCTGTAIGCSADYDGSGGGGAGSGRYPGSYSASGKHIVGGSQSITCHENDTGSVTDQDWNSKTPW